MANKIALKMFYCPRCSRTVFTTLETCSKCGNGMMDVSPINCHLEPEVNMGELMIGILDLAKEEEKKCENRKPCCKKCKDKDKCDEKE